MKPKKSAVCDLQGSLFHVELVKIIDMPHPLVTLAGKIGRDSLEAMLDSNFCEDNGAPAKPVRLVVGLQYLKHAFTLSDELTVERCTENSHLRRQQKAESLQTYQAPAKTPLGNRAAYHNQLFGNLFCAIRE